MLCRSWQACGWLLEIICIAAVAFVAEAADTKVEEEHENDLNICEQLVSGHTDIAAYGIHNNHRLLLDIKHWHGYHLRQSHKKPTPLKPPFREAFLSTIATSAKKIFPAWVKPSEWPADLFNSFIIDLDGSCGLVLQFKPPANKVYWLFTAKSEKKMEIEAEPKLADVLIIGAKETHYTWGLNISSGSKQACLVTIQFAHDLSKVEKHRFTNRCMTLNAPVHRGFVSVKTGYVTIFHTDRTVSLFNTGGLGFQLLEHKPYSEFFVCDFSNHTINSTTSQLDLSDESSHAPLIWILISSVCAGIFCLLLTFICIFVAGCKKSDPKPIEKKRVRKAKRSKRNRKSSKMSKSLPSDSKSEE